MNEAQERYEFEQLMRKHYPQHASYATATRGDGEYINPDIRLAWWAWQRRAEFDNVKLMAIQPRLEELQRVAERLAEILTKIIRAPEAKKD